MHQSSADPAKTPLETVRVKKCFVVYFISEKVVVASFSLPIRDMLSSLWPLWSLWQLVERCFGDVAHKGKNIVQLRIDLQLLTFQYNYFPINMIFALI